MTAHSGYTSVRLKEKIIHLQIGSDIFITLLFYERVGRLRSVHTIKLKMIAI